MRPRYSIMLPVGLLMLVMGFYWFFSARETHRQQGKVASNSQSTKPASFYLQDYSFSHPYISQADSFQRVGETDSAISHYQKAVASFLKERNWEGYVHTINAMAGCYVKKGDSRQAIVQLEQTESLAIKKLGRMHPLLGTVYFQLGRCYWNETDPAKSLEAHQRALAVRIACFGPNSKWVAYSYQGMGDVYRYTLFDYHLAEKYYHQALQIGEKLPEKDSLDLIYNYYNLATTNRLKGDLEKALTYGYQALDLMQAQSKQNLSHQEKCYALLANIYKDQKDYQQAIAFFDHAIKLNTRNHNASRLLAFLYDNLGQVYSYLGSWEKAKTLHHNALNLVSKAKDAETAADAYFNMGNVYQQQGWLDSSLYYYNQCLAIRSDYFGKHHKAVVLVYQQMGKLYQEQHQPDKAIAYYQQALSAGLAHVNFSSDYQNPSINEVGTQYYLFQVLAQKGAALKARYEQHGGKETDLRAALSCYQLADSLMHFYLRDYDREGSKLFFVGSYQPIYEEALECAYLLFKQTGRRKYLEEAFTFLENSKSRLLLETLTQLEASQLAGTSDSLRNLERSLKADLLFYQQQFEREVRTATPDSMRLHTFRSALFAADRKLEKLKDELARQYPHYFRIKYHQKFLSLRQVESYAEKTQSRLVTYFWGEKSVFAMSIDQQQVQLRRIERSPKLDQAVTQYGDLLAGGYELLSTSRPDSAFGAYAHTSYYLYQALLAPLVPSSKKNGEDHRDSSVEKLIIIPDGPLASIPFESLISRLPPAGFPDYSRLFYLVYRFQIHYAYSGHLLLEGNQGRQPLSAARVLAFSYTGGQQSASDKVQLVNLPGTARELKAIEDAGLSGEFLSGDQATETNFKNKAPHFDILHLAIHGKADWRHQMSSYLLFKPGTDSTEDGSLSVHELYDISLQTPRLVVLSACETGVGKWYKGEGTYSMARAFAYAGCPSIIMSLWQVEDNQTKAIMGHFYQELAQGGDIDYSLHQAKLHYLKGAQGLKAHPFFWAALAPLGDSSAVQINLDKTLIIQWILAVTAVEFLLLLLVGSYRKMVALR